MKDSIFDEILVAIGSPQTIATPIVAGKTGQPQIFEFIRSATTARFEMVEGQLTRRK